MPTQLRIASNDRRTGIVSEGVRCGMEFCGAVLGDLISIDGIQYVSLLEGYRKEKTGDYKLHRHAEWRNRRGMPPKDAHPRWSGVRPDGTWGPGGSAASMTGGGLQSDGRYFPEGPQKERLATRERVNLDQLQVSCLVCGFSNTLDGNA